MSPRRSFRPRYLMFMLILSLSCNLSAPAGGPPSPLPPPETSAPPAPSPTPFPTIETFYADDGRRLWLSSNHLRVAVDTVWGGAIREIWLDGDNVVNNFDGGRLIAVSFYDGFRPPASNQPNDTGWNPTPAHFRGQLTGAVLQGSLARGRSCRPVGLGGALKKTGWPRPQTTSY